MQQSFSVAAYALLGLVFTSLALEIYRVVRDPLRHIPGPFLARCTSLVEKYHLLTGNKPRYVFALHQKYGPVVRVSPHEVAISDISAVKQIHKVGGPYLKSGYYTHIGHKSYKTIFSTMDAQYHAKRRKLLSGPMSDNNLRQYEPLVASRVNLCMTRMAEEAQHRGVMDVFKWWLFLTTDTIGELAFGESFRMLEHGQKSQYIIDLELVAGLMVMRTTFPFIVNLANYITIPIFKRAAQSGARMIGYARQSVERLKQHSLKQDERDFKPTLFSKMFNAGENGLTDFEIMLEAGGYITAGSDTTAISLTYLVWAVCGNPGVKQKLVAEVDALPEDFDDNHARALPYLGRVIDETLRMYPAAPGALPRAVPPSGAVLAGYHFPGGTTVSSQAYTLHRDPNVFPNPERFDPDRWAEPTKDMKAAFMPFGGGTRICIGMHLARVELRLAVAHFFRLFPHAKRSSKEGMSKADLVQEMYFLVNPKGHRCLIDPK